MKVLRTAILGFSMMLAAAVPAAAAPGVPVKGVVRDAQGEAIPGVVLQGEGNQNAVTDLDGGFSLNVPSGSEIRVSCLGYLPYSFKAGRENINIVLMEDSQSLEESVVIGYGTQKKAVITGSVTSISDKAIATTTANDVVTKLQGKVSGLNIRKNTGFPGLFDHTINVRGFGAPIYVIDGVTRDASDFDKLNAEDISSITVLKDASAAIYGLNAGNGVIIVTTRTGNNYGAARFQFNANVGWSTPTDRVQMSDGYEYYYLRNAANINAGDPEYISPEELEMWRTGVYSSTDWYAETCRKFAMRQEYSLSADGGVKGVKYYFNVNYSKDDGILRSGDIRYDKWSFRTTVTADLSPVLKLSANVSGYMDDRISPSSDIFNILRGTITSLPYKPVYATTDVEPYNAYPFYNGVKDGQAYNPVAQAFISNVGYSRPRNNSLQSVFTLTYTPEWLTGLEMKGQVAFDKRFYQAKGLRNNWKMYTYDVTSDSVSSEDWNPLVRITNSNTNLHKYNYQAQANYHKDVADAHHIGASAIFEARAIDSDWTSIEKYFDFYTNDQIDFAGDKDAKSGGNESHQRNISFIGRLNYDFKGRYLLEAAVRRDGSYRYHPDVRWGTFPMVSAGWRISEEAWMQGIKWMSNLKLRGSYGVIGEDAGAAFQYISGYSVSGGGWWEFDPEAVTNGVSSPALVNEKLSWMKSYLVDFGLDLGLLSNRLNIVFDVFRKDKTGILAYRNVTIPNTFGADFPQENLNSNRTQGLEFSASWQDRAGDFFYTVSGNATYGRTMNRYIERADYTGSWVRYRNGSDYRWSDLGWAYKVIGQFQSYEEIENYAIYSGVLGNKYVQPGDWKYEDTNGDGLINADDMRPISLAAGRNPIWNYGLTLSGSWRGLDLNILFQGAAGFVVYYEGPYAHPFWQGGNIPSFYMDAWHHQNAYDSDSPWIPGTFPAIRMMDQDPYRNYPSVMTYRDCSYLRLKNVEIGYTLSGKILRKAGLDKVRVFVNGNNLLTFCDKYIKAFDPEKVAGNSNLGWNYPLMLTLNTGVNVNF